MIYAEVTGKAIVDRIDTLIKARNLKRKAVADAVGISLQPFTSWANRGSLPSSDIAYRIAKYLNVSIEWLLTGEEMELPPRDDLELARRIAALPPEYRDMVMRQVEGFEGLCLRSQGEEKESGSA